MATLRDRLKTAVARAAETKSENDGATGAREALALEKCMQLLRNKKAGEAALKKAEAARKTLIRMQQKALYGQAERAQGLEIDEDFGDWALEQKDRLRVELPEPLQDVITQEAVEILLSMRIRYSKVLGADDELVKLTQERILSFSKRFDGLP